MKNNSFKCPFCYAYFADSKSKIKRCGDCGKIFQSIPIEKGSTFALNNKSFMIVDCLNHDFPPVRHGFAYESFRHPDLRKLRRKYSLSLKIIKPYKSEFIQQLAMRDWVCAAWTSGQPSVKTPHGPLPEKDFHIEDMITKARTKGNNYFCSYKAVASVELASAFGWIARLVNIDGFNGPTKKNHGHMVYEMWSNEFNKWFFQDSFFNFHFEKNNIPLSVREIREEYYKNKGVDLECKWGIGRTKLPYDISGAMSPYSFEWYVVYQHNNFFDFKPGDHLFPLLMPKDLHNKRKKWKKTGSPGKSEVYLCKSIVVEESDPEYLDYPINQIHLYLLKYEDNLEVRANHNMPNFDRIEIKTDKQKRRKYKDQREVSLFWKPQAKHHILEARCINSLGVSGNSSFIKLERE